MFERELDTEADRQTTGFLRAPVDSFHRPRTTTSDHRIAGPDERGTEPFAQGVIGVVHRNTGRAEDRHRSGQLREQPEPLDELALDPQDPPRVGVDPVGRTTSVQQVLVGR